MRRFALLLALIAAPVWAQDAETLADIRQDLTVLNVEVQKLRRELSTTGGASLPSGGTMLDRVLLIEAELQRLTGKTEELEFRINRVIEDGTNRIGDLEFRLVELEGGDVSQLAETSTLGGELPETQTAVAPSTPSQSETSQELAVQEEVDLRLAREAFANGEFASAAERLASFNQTYPGSPLAVEASMLRGDALNELGDTREASRAFLDAYNAAPDGANAPKALLKLGQGLADLGQTDAACRILGELAQSFSGVTEGSDAATLSQSLNCPA